MKRDSNADSAKTYTRKYNRHLHQKATHEGDVVGATPIQFIGGGGEWQRSPFKQVRSILSNQRPEKGDRAKKSIPLGRIQTALHALRKAVKISAGSTPGSCIQKQKHQPYQ